MKTFRILLAGFGVACGSATVSAQTSLFSTKPTVAAPTPTTGLLPAAGQGSMLQPSELQPLPSTGLSSQPIPGAVYSPWCGDRPAGSEGIGGNGSVTYQNYLRSGPSILGEAGGFNGALQRTGWVVQTGARTLFFNPTSDAAWTLDLGLGYTFNRGNRLAKPIAVSANSLKGSDAASDFTLPLGIRSMNRTSLNFGLGRDWFLNGPGNLGQAPESNWCFGTDVGGRWGTASVGFEPQDDPDGYRRRQGVYHGVYLGTHLDWERNIGGWIFLAGIRAEYSYNWTNLIPPQDGNIQDINIMLTLGVRF